MAGIEAENYLQKYENYRSELDQQLQNVQDIKDQKFQVKDKANEIVKTLAEAKLYLSGKVVSQYAVSQAKSAAERLGQKLNGGEEEAVEEPVEDGAVEATAESTANADYAWMPFSAARDSSLSRGAVGESSIENNYGEISQSDAGWPARPAAEQYLDNDEETLDANAGQAGAGVSEEGAAGQSGLDSALYDNAFDESVGMNNPLYEGGSQVSNYLDVAPRAGNNILSQASEDIEGVGNIERSDIAADKSLVGEGGEAEAAGDEAAETTAEIGEEEAATAEIPFVDIAGLIAAGGLLIHELVKKPHLHTAVDHISSSYQVGV